ncbi:hypothetical protein EDC04DRAFT_698433 [Pisolithus marmoratus]|nr:hypothetical protein EDC04DRAFT_698433 [Pisolithus marmoratus]
MQKDWRVRFGVYQHHIHGEKCDIFWIVCAQGFLIAASASMSPMTTWGVHREAKALITGQVLSETAGSALFRSEGMAARSRGDFSTRFTPRFTLHIVALYVVNTPMLLCIDRRRDKDATAPERSDSHMYSLPVSRTPVSILGGNNGARGDTYSPRDIGNGYNNGARTTPVARNATTIVRCNFEAESR